MSNNHKSWGVCVELDTGRIMPVCCTINDHDINLRIINSFKIQNKKDIRKALELIHATPPYRNLVEAGYNRTFESEYREWAGHNTLYRWGIYRERTGSVDINNNEPKWRRIIYAFLSMFGR